MYKRTFWDNVKSFLVRDLNQTWLAHEIGISPNTLSMMISRDSIPKADIAQRISDVLGVPLSKLLEGDGSLYQSKLSVKEQSYPFYGGEEVLSHLIPITSSTLTYHEEGKVLSPKNYIGSVRVLHRMANNYKVEDLVAIHVVGDGMRGMNLYDNDIAVFAKGHIASNGIYAIALRNKIQINRLEFDLLTEKVTIVSEHPHFKPVTIDSNNDHFIILGIVVGWIHLHF